MYLKKCPILKLRNTTTHSKGLYKMKGLISYKEEWVNNDLCRKNHITMIRLLEKKYRDFDNCICLTYLGYSLEIIDQLIKKVFSLVHIETDIDIIDDIFEIENVWKASITERQ